MSPHVHACIIYFLCGHSINIPVPYFSFDLSKIKFEYHKYGNDIFIQNCINKLQYLCKSAKNKFFFLTAQIWSGIVTSLINNGRQSSRLILTKSEEKSKKDLTFFLGF